MTKSASSIYVEYAYEPSFKAGGGGTFPMLFGKEQKANSLEFRNNQMPLANLYSPEVTCYAYGRNEGKVSMEYVLANPWFIESILHSGASAPDTGALYTHTWDSDPSVNPDIRGIKSMALRIGYEVDTDYIRLPTGAICTALSLKSSLNDTVKISQEIAWGSETVNQTFATPTGTSLPGEIGYTFVHAVITSPLTGSTLATIQDFELNMNTNGELVYELGNADSASAFRKILDLTGRVTVTVKDSTFLEEIYARAESANDMTITISNGAAGDAERSITITLSGVSLSAHNNSGIAPGELVLENVDFQARRINVVAKNEETAIP